MELETYANQNGWELVPWSGQNSSNLETWEKEFEDDRKVQIGHEMFTAVVFHQGGHQTLRTRRRGHNDFVSTLETLIRVDELKGKPWPADVA